MLLEISQFPSVLGINLSVPHGRYFGVIFFFFWVKVFFQKEQCALKITKYFDQILAATPNNWAAYQKACITKKFYIWRVSIKNQARIDIQ